MVLLRFMKSYFSDFYFFRVNDNTMRSYYRHDRLLLSKYCMIIIVYMATMVSVASVLSGPRQHMLGEWRQSSLSTASTYLIHIFTYFRDFWCE